MTVHRFLDFELDTDLRELRRSGGVISVEPQVFDLLIYLIEHRDRLITRDELFENIWRGRIVSDATLSSRIKAARQAVGDTGKDQSVIQTLPRRGFRFVAAVEVAADPPTPAVTPHLERQMQEVRLEQASKPSLAVLPFENLTSDPDQEFLCDGIADDIINMLSVVPSLRVIARQSTSRYRRERGDLRRIAEDLSVRYILGGSVRRSGNRLRISAQLIDAHDESQIWADRYDRDLTDIFDIQDEVMKEVVTALQVKLTTGEDALFEARGTKNVEAWKYCILARNNFFTLTAMHHLEARKLAEKAIEIDPNYAYPWMILGMSYMREGRLGQADRTAALRRAEEYVDKALSLDGALGLALGFKAVLYAAMGDPVNGVQAARRAIALSPGNAQLRYTVSFALSFAGEYEEALKNAEIGVDLDPFATARYHIAKIRCYALLERFDEAIAIAEKVLEEERGLVAPLIWLAYSAHSLKQFDRAEEAVKELNRHAPHFGARNLRGFLTTPDTAAVDRVVAALRESGLRDDTYPSRLECCRRLDLSSFE